MPDKLKAPTILSRRWMMWGLGFALLLRLAFPTANYLGLSESRHTDSYDYVQNAQALVDDGVWEFWRRPPGYPLFLIEAGALKPGGQINLNSVLLLQGLLGLVACGLTFWGARRLLGDSAARWAVLLIALDLTSMVYGNLMLSECLFTTLLTASLLCTLVGQTPRATAGAALLLAAACYVRPVGLVLAFLWPLMLWVVLRNRKKAAVFFSVVWLLLLPWFVRQKVEFGAFMFSGITHENPLVHNAAYVLAEIEGAPVADVQQRLIESVPFHQWPSKGYEILLAHPFVFLYTVAKGVPFTLLSPGPYAFQAMFPSGASWFHTAGAVFACLFWVWLPFTAYAIREKAGLFLLATALYLIVIPGPQGRSRFRVPAVPALAICAAIGLSRIEARRRDDRNG